MPFKSEKGSRKHQQKKNQWQQKNRVTNHGKTNHSEQGAERVRI